MKPNLLQRRRRALHRSQHLRRQLLPGPPLWIRRGRRCQQALTHLPLQLLVWKIFYTLLQ